VIWEGVLEQLPSLGVAGLLFVMWWQERQERVRQQALTAEETGRVDSWRELTDQVLGVVQGNTAALTALRTELRAQRAADLEFFGRLSRQLERLEAK
jgi:hypothetical protein